MTHASRWHPSGARAASARSAEFLRRRRSDRIRSVRRRLPDRAQMDPGADRVCSYARNDHGADRADPGWRAGRCDAQQASSSKRRPDRRHHRGAAAGAPANTIAGPRRADPACLRELRADAGHCRDQPASGGICGARRATGAECPLCLDRQWSRRGGDGSDGRMAVEPRRLPADRGALRARHHDIGTHRPRHPLAPADHHTIAGLAGTARPPH